MGTHATLGIKFADNTIVGCYVHYDGDTMRGRIEDFLEKYTTTGLALLIAKAQGAGGIRSFYCSSWVGNGLDGPPETEFLDDNEPYLIDEVNWREDHYGASYQYLVDYETAFIQKRTR